MKNFNLYESFLNKPKMKIAGSIATGILLVAPVLSGCSKTPKIENPENIAREAAQENYDRKIKGIKGALEREPECMKITFVEQGNYYSIEVYTYIYECVQNGYGEYENANKKLYSIDYYILFANEAKQENLTDILNERIETKKSK